MIYRLLDYPLVYLASQFLIGAMRARRTCIQSYVSPRTGSRILDIGCGPGYVLDYLPEVDYVGYDTDPNYIRYAVRRYGDKGRFACGVLTADKVEGLGKFDVVMLMGVLHHLDDGAARDVLLLAYQALKPGGRVVALEQCYKTGQPWMDKLLLDLDRGKFVRDENGYRALAKRAFEDVRLDIRQDLFWIPNTSAVITCVRPAG